MKNRTVVALAAVAGLLLVALVGCRTSPPEPRAASRTSPPESTPEQDAGSLVDRSRDQGPFLRGKKLSVAQAEAEAGFQLLRPHHPQANDGNIRNVFISQERDERGKPWAQVAIDYESGLIMLVLPAWVDGTEKDPRKEYQEVVDTYPGPYARVTTVHDVPALVIERNPKGTAFLSVVIHGVKVKLFAEYAPLEASQLTEMAESLS